MTERSSFAVPPITDEEARGAALSVCPHHGAHPAPGWFREGRVFHCPIGDEFWRYSEQGSGGGMYRTLQFPTGL
jgi:hypothetical protein